MAANPTGNQVEMNDSLTTEHGHLITGSDSEDNEYTNVTISSSQTDQVKDPAKYHFYGVPAENKAFVDRPKILASMETALGSPRQGCRILALKGPGGRGKTQLMLRYCYLHRATYEYVFWLEVDSWSTAIDSFRNLAINLGIDEESTKGKDSESKIISWVRSWFQKKTKWLLLLNNADDTMSKDVFKFLPRIGGDIILTTRETIPSKMAIVIPVDKMYEEEALLLLLGLSSMTLKELDGKKLHYAREIVIQLDFIPLAINLARAYISNTLASFRNYLSMFKKAKRHISLLRHNRKHNDTTVWRMSLKKVRALNPATVKILEVCSFFQPESIPTSLFKQQYSMLAIKVDSQQPSEAIEKAIAVLVKFSFLTRTCREPQDGVENPASDLLTIHRVVQKFIFDTMNRKQKLLWAYNIARALNNDTSFSYSAIYTPQTREIMDTYLSHIRHFVALLDSLGKKPFKSKDLSELLNRGIWYLLRHGRYFGVEELIQFSRRVSEATYGGEDDCIVISLMNHADLYHCQGKYLEAEPLYQRALAIREKIRGSEHFATAAPLHNLALLYVSEGRYGEAEPLYKRSLAIFEKLAPEHSDTAKTMSNLASLYCYRGKYGEAEPFCKRALAICEKVSGSEHPDTANSLTNLAVLYYNQGKYGETERLCKQALAIYEKAFGSEHPDTANSLNNVGVMYKHMGKYDEAEPLCKQALAIREKTLGSEHPDTAQSLNALAIFYHGHGKYDKAEPLYKRALAIQEKALGSEHPDTAESLNSLAIFYVNRGKYGEAEALNNRAIAIRQKVLGQEHPAMVMSLSALARLFVHQGRYSEAEPLYKRALKFQQEVFSLTHPNTTLVMNSLGNLYKKQGKFDDAELLYQQALNIRKEMLGSMHLDTAISVSNLADLYLLQGKAEDAEPLCRLALAIRQEVLGLVNPITAKSLNNMAVLYKVQCKYDIAEPLFQQVLEIREKMLGLMHPDTATSVNNLGDLYISLNRYEDAEPLIQHALAINEKVLGPEHPDTARSLNDLAQLLVHQGKYDEAELLYKRSLAIREKVLGSLHPATTTTLHNFMTVRKNMATL